jgi:hypothetical protein
MVAAAATACVQNDPPAQVATAATAQPSPSISVSPDRWRAVLVAGDSSSPAFNNGVESMRDRLSGDGVRNISLLAADPSGMARAEVASSPNVRRALATPGGAACLAFMTSHGDTRGFFLRASRMLLAPSALEQALDQGCADVPTVVIVSACHSGTFLTDRLKKANRIVLTAAATDRSSFGCGADNEYTEYDRCLLQQMDRAATWRELAAATKACVEVAERRLGVRQHSLPQTFFGSAVTDLRLPGK